MSQRRPPSPEVIPLRCAQAGGFTLTEGIHAGGSFLPWHTHPGPTICYVLEGGFTEYSGHSAVTCTPTTLKVMPAGERHCDRFDRGGARGLLIEAAPSRVESIRPYSGLLEELVWFHGGVLAAIAHRVHREFRRMDEAAPLAIEGLLLELLASASRRRGEPVSGTPPAWVGEARDIIHADPVRRRTLTELAAQVGVHEVTLARAFRRAYGCSVGEYVRRLRIERAVEELGHTDRPLAEIALGAGFSDQSHFSNVFRRHTGISPSSYRRAVRPSQRAVSQESA
jgi:AraC family transcriptional regulator